MGELSVGELSVDKLSAGESSEGESSGHAVVYLPHWTEYDRKDSFLPVLGSNGNPVGLITKGKFCWVSFQIKRNIKNFPYILEPNRFSLRFNLTFIHTEFVYGLFVYVYC